VEDEGAGGHAGGSRHFEGLARRHSRRMPGFSLYFPGSNEKRLTDQSRLARSFVCPVLESRWTVRLAFVDL
jgi:hypothetical protein